MVYSEYASYLKKNYAITSTFVTGLSAFLVDILVIMLCLCLGFFCVNLVSTHDIEFISFINYIVFIPMMMIIFSFLGLYPGIMISPSEEVRKYATGTFFSFGLIFLCILYSNSSGWKYIKTITSYTGDGPLLFAFLLAFIFSLFLLPGIRDYSRLFFCHFNWYGVPAVIYTTDNGASTIVDKLLAKKYLGYRPCIILDTNPTVTEYKGIPIFKSDDSEILSILKKHNVKNAILCDYHGNISAVMNCYRYTISVSKTQTSFTSTQHIKDIDGIIGFSSTHNLTFKTNLFLKRFLDISLIILVSPILVPVFLILMFLTKITSKGPVFYGHKRVGKDGKEFKCWKFRSMNIHSAEMLEQILANDPVRAKEWDEQRKFSDDPRVTKFGKFLRKTSLDELPQLINVLLGQMSIVGPRPVTAPELEKYGSHKDYVLSVSPGLSGMWQISGRSETSYDERIYYDTYYIQNWSVWLDIWILIKTVGVVLIGKGAY